MAEQSESENGRTQVRFESFNYTDDDTSDVQGTSTLIGPSGSSETPPKSQNKTPGTSTPKGPQEQSETPALKIKVDPLPFLQNGSYKSRIPSKKGFDYQEELLIFFGLMGLADDYNDFFLGYEVEGFTPFGDGVCKFMRKDGTYDVYCWQAKNFPTKTVSNAMIKGVDKDFGLASYLPSIVEIDGKICKEEKLKNIYFLFFTTAHGTLEGVTELEQLDPEDISIFKKICDFPQKPQRKCLIYRFPPEYIKELQTDEAEEQTESIKRGRGRPPSTKNQQHRNKMLDNAKLPNNSKLIWEKFIYLLSTPNEKEFMELNLTILEKMKPEVLNMNEINNEYSFYTHFKKNLFDSIEKEDDKNRPILNKEKFNELMLKSVIDADLPPISKEFLNKKLKITLPRRALAPQKRNIFVKQGDSACLSSLKTYMTSNSMEDVLLVPLQSLSLLHLKAVKYSRWGIVVLVDEPTKIEDLPKEGNNLFLCTDDALEEVADFLKNIKTANETNKDTEADRQASENKDIEADRQAADIDKNVEDVTRKFEKLKTEERSASN